MTGNNLEYYIETLETVIDEGRYHVINLLYMITQV